MTTGSIVKTVQQHCVVWNTPDTHRTCDYISVEWLPPRHHNVLFSLVVWIGLGLALGYDYSVQLVVGYVHVFILPSIVIGTVPVRQIQNETIQP